MPEDRPLPGQPAATRTALVSWRRVPGWIDRFEARHPGTTWDVSATAASAHSPDGSSVTFDVPVAPLADPTMPGLLAHLTARWQLAVVLVRRGGFAVARVIGDEVVESKVGKRHVQGRTKAGGWSQQRFARRRDNQAQAAFDAAGAHVLRLVVPHARSLDLLVLGGDKAAVEVVLATPELAPLGAVPHQWLPGLPDPRREVLDRAVEVARSVRVQVLDTTFSS